MKRHSFLINTIAIILVLVTFAAYITLIIISPYKYRTGHYLLLFSAIFIDLAVIGFYFRARMLLTLYKYSIVGLFFSLYAISVMVIADSILWFSFMMVFVALGVSFCQNFLQKRKKRLPSFYSYTLVILSCSIFIVCHVWNILSSQKLESAFKRANFYGLAITSEQAKNRYYKDTASYYTNRDNKKIISKNISKPNGAPIILAACDVISEKFDAFYMPIFRKYSFEDGNVMRVPQEEENVRQFFRDLEKELRVLEEGLSYSVRKIPIDFPEEASDAVNIPDYPSIVFSASKALHHKFFFEVKDKKYEKSIKTLKQIFMLAEMIEHGTIGDLIKRAILRQSMEATAEVLHLSPSADFLTELISLWEDKCKYVPIEIEQEIFTLSLFVEFFQEDKYACCDLLDENLYENWFLRYLPNGLIKQDFAYAINHVIDQVRINQKGENAVRNSFKDKKETPSFFFISQHYGYGNSLNLNYFDRLAQFRCLYISLKAMIYKLKNNEFPEKLEDLNLEQNVTDPFTGENLKIHENNEEYIVYSVGRSMVDEKGRLLNHRYGDKYHNVGIAINKGE